MLSICIPTHNRAEELVQLLDNICSENIEICVSDNASVDRTENVVKELQKHHTNLKYNRNSKNLGYYENVKKTLVMSSGRYVWLLGDDDVPMKNAIEEILGNLLGNDFLIINSEIWNKDMSKHNGNNTLKISEDRLYKRGEHQKILKDVGSYSLYMGSMVIRRDVIMDQLILNKDSLRTDAGKNYPHTLLFYNGIVGLTGKLISKCLLKIRGENGSWDSRIMDLIYIQSHEVFAMLKGYSKTPKLPIVEYVRAIRASKKAKRHPFSYYIKYINQLKEDNIKKLIITFAALLPVGILDIITFMYKKIIVIRWSL
jgi:glycosyltransferase involved in cell wall biosynthesis